MCPGVSHPLHHGKPTSWGSIPAHLDLQPRAHLDLALVETKAAEFLDAAAMSRTQHFTASSPSSSSHALSASSPRHSLNLQCVLGTLTQMSHLDWTTFSFLHAVLMVLSRFSPLAT